MLGMCLFMKLLYKPQLMQSRTWVNTIFTTLTLFETTQKKSRVVFFLFSFRNARLSVPAPASPEGNKASLLLFGNLSQPHVNNCAGHCGGFIYAHVDCIDMYTTIYRFCNHIGTEYSHS